MKPIITVINGALTIFVCIDMVACSGLPISEGVQRTILGGAKSALISQKKEPPLDASKLVHDKGLHDYVTKVGEKVRKEAGVATLEYRVVDTDVIQGTAGGFFEVFLTKGLINEMESEAELACFIGHEIHHHVQSDKDPTNSANDDQSLAETFFLNAPAALQGYGIHKDIGDIKNANYSKRKETDADEQGAVLCAKAGYDPYALARFQFRLAKQIEASPLESVRNLTGTHEQMIDRSTHLREWLAKRGYVEGLGFTRLAEFSQALQTQSKLSRTQIQTLEKVDVLEKRATEAEQFENNMANISRMIVQEGLTLADMSRELSGLPSGRSFMQERLVSQRGNIAGFRERLTRGLSRVLDTMTSNLRFATLSSMVDFYDLCTGRDFMSDRPLSHLARALRALRYGRSNSFADPKNYSRMSAEAKECWAKAKSESARDLKPEMGSEFTKNQPTPGDGDAMNDQAAVHLDELEPNEILYECDGLKMENSYRFVSVHKAKKFSIDSVKSLEEFDCNPRAIFKVKERVSGLLAVNLKNGRISFHIPKQIPTRSVLQPILND